MAAHYKFVHKRRRKSAALQILAERHGFQDPKPHAALRRVSARCDNETQVFEGEGERLSPEQKARQNPRQRIWPDQNVVVFEKAIPFDVKERTAIVFSAERHTGCGVQAREVGVIALAEHAQRHVEPLPRGRLERVRVHAQRLLALDERHVEPAVAAQQPRRCQPGYARADDSDALEWRGCAFGGNDSGG